MTNNQVKEQALRAFLESMFNAYPTHSHLIIVIDAEKNPVNGAIHTTLSVNPQCSDEYWVQFTTPPDES
jgi:hypothetical protein